jgi:mutator protein MutT
MTKERHKIVPAAYIILTKGSKIFLARRFNTGYEDGKYSLPAGHVEAGETFTQCIIREAEEEIGIILNTADLKMAHAMQRLPLKDQNNERVDIFFTTNKWEGEITNKEPHKCDDLSWFDLNKIPENIIPYVKHAIECINKDIIYSEFDCN